MQPKRFLARGLALVLWVATAALGLFEILLIRDMLLRIYARSGGGYWPAVTAGNWALVPLALAWIALVVGGGEYHRKRVGQRSSWRLFLWTIAVELAILVLAYFI